ncbi:MAG: hypothetical protein LBS28_05090 [Streptococcaceae bacterium]|nr:hypothetical protein [Streptococcaceae bacterium]
MYFFHLILKNIFPVIISFIILICVISKISFFTILASYVVVLGFGNYWLISEEIDAQEVEFLLLRILPYQLSKDRRKLYFTLIFQHTFSSYIIYILNWILILAISKNLLYASLGVLFTIFDFFLQFLLLLKKYYLMQSFIRNSHCFLKIKVDNYADKPWKNIFGLALHRMIQKNKKKLIMPIFYLSLLLFFVFYFFKDYLLSCSDTFILYYYSIIPSLYFVFIKLNIDESDFFSLSEETNYYYMKRFRKRHHFIKQFSLVIFKNTLLPAIVLISPVYFLKPFLQASLFSLLCLTAMYFIVRLSMIQKTAMINYSFEEIRQDYSLTIINAIAQIEDLLVVNSAVLLNSCVFYYYLKFKMTFLAFLFPIFYFLFIIIYTYIKGMVIDVKNK